MGFVEKSNLKDISPTAAELRDLFEDTLGLVGASTRVVADQIGMSQTALSSFLRGACEPRKSSLAKIRDWCDSALAHRKAADVVSPIDRLPMHPAMPRPKDGRNWRKRT